MKRFILTISWCFLVCAAGFAQNADLRIIPQPRSVEKRDGEFKFNRKTRIVATDEAGRRSAAVLNELLMKHYGFKLGYAEKEQPKNAIAFEPSGTLPPEGYGLKVSPKGVSIAGNETGQFYALQTLLQLLPVEFKGAARIPAVEIADAPRFAYRGMHLDVGRHFFPVEFIKKYLDLMAQYKFNQFHWHLTEDQGWRIEIKKYPRLTAIGSKRTETQKEKNRDPYVGDAVPVEGFYTQEQIKEVVAYARARKINVIPEIELPGHSSAALAAYPELGCKENYDYRVKTTWGIFKEVYCPTEATFKFLEDVLEETIALFPDSPYIHIGGDEVLKDHWKESAFVQELKAKENLKDEHEVQSYFIRRMEKFINSKGKKIIGWDEILEGGLAPNATVMSWRGEKGGIEAAKAKHDVVMTPANALYFDFGQGDPQSEPINIGNHLPLETVYAYNPVPKELSPDEAKYILGAQANVWTEFIKTPEKVEYMVFPRLLALAEVVWSPLEKKDFADFQRRMRSHYARLDRQNVSYRIPAPEGLENRLAANDAKQIFTLKAPLDNAKIFYTLDGSTPTENSALYEKPLFIGLSDNKKIALKTIVVNEKGRKSVVHGATVWRRELIKAVEPKEKRAGVTVDFYKGDFRSVNELGAAKPLETFASKSIQLPQFAGKTNNFKDAFGASFEGYIYAPEDAIYEFQIETAGGGAALAVGGEPVVEAFVPESGELSARYGVVPLGKGFHKISLRYVETGGDTALNLRWGVKGTGLRRIYGSELYY